MDCGAILQITRDCYMLYLVLVDLPFPFAFTPTLHHLRLEWIPAISHSYCARVKVPLQHNTRTPADLQQRSSTAKAVSNTGIPDLS
jgi:hypothetical protein